MSVAVPQAGRRAARLLRPLLVPFGFLVLPLALFWPVLWGEATLVPFDALYSGLPWAAFRDELGVGQPHNELVSDLVLQNFQWKAFAVSQLRAGELPLWQPAQLAGSPFLAAGQHSMLYPLSWLFLVLPPLVAFGWFSVLSLALAGTTMYLFGRALGLQRSAAGLAGLVYQGSGFLTLSVVFPMIVAAAAWLPLLLAALRGLANGWRREERGERREERETERQKAKGKRQKAKGTTEGGTGAEGVEAGNMSQLSLHTPHSTPYTPHPIPSVALGAVAIGMAALAGHVEMLYYTLLVGGLYALWLLVFEVRSPTSLVAGSSNFQTAPAVNAVNAVNAVKSKIQNPKSKILFTLWGAAMLLTGLLLGAAQTVPLYEMVSQNFREGSASLAEVRGYAWPLRQASAWVVPELLGNPARHRFWNLETRQWEPIVTQQPIDAAGNTVSLDHVAWFKGTPDWKNAVEGAGYLGILPLLLAGAAVEQRMRRMNGFTARPSAGSSVFFFAVLALVSVLFIFGTPLYALLFYGLPGWNQLHTPFRWIFPLTVAVSVLAGVGWEGVNGKAKSKRQKAKGKSDGDGPAPRTGRTIPFILHPPREAFILLAGLLGLLVLAAMWVAPAPFLDLAAKVLDRSQLAKWAFGGSAALFLSYQWANFLHLGLALLGAALALHLARRPPYPFTRSAKSVVLLVVVGADLLAATWGFMPQVPARVAEFTPPSVQWLAERHAAGAWRYTALERDWKVLNANATMQYGLEDARGYDSIILKHYVEYMEAVSPQGQLPFNRVAPLRAETPPDQELLDLLNVRFLATDQTLDWPGWALAYEGELRIYENGDVMPRAFLLGNGTYWGLRSQPIPPETLQTLEPREQLYLQGDEGGGLARDPLRSDLPFTPVEIGLYTPNEISMPIAPPTGAWLVLSDVDFPGWRVFTQAAGGEEREREVMRANGAFRAVWVEAGPQTVRWTYSPNSVKVGFFASFLGTAALGLAGAVWGWGRLYPTRADEGTARRVARNSVAPMALQLFNKAIDTVFAAFMARFLGPAALGQYAFAVALIWYFIIFSNFGLGTLLTRDAARDPGAAARLLGRTLALRAALYALAFPALLAGLWAWGRVGGLEATTAWAIGLLALGLIPSNVADALTAVFRAQERFEVPALVATVATFVKVSVGAGALLAGWGIVGLAATSMVTNLVTLAILAALLAPTVLRPAWAARGLSGANAATRPYRALLGDALPLMVNELLATAFFRIDQVLLKPLRGNAEAGFYNVAYKFIDGLLVLPSALTLALFPVMSRAAQGAPDALLRTTVFALRWLVMVALPIALLTTRFAGPIVLLFGGPDFLPEAATALQILIWFLPFSFVNSLLQYVLIAADRQHALTRAYGWALGFNLVANIVAIRAFGLNGAAAVTIASEVALLVPFYRLLRGSVGPLPWWDLFGKPALALLVAALPLWVVPAWLALPASVALYGAALWGLRAFRAEDRLILAKVLPGRTATGG